MRRDELAATIIKYLNKTDYSTYKKRRQLVDERIERVLSIFKDSTAPDFETYLDVPYKAKREQAIIHYLNAVSDQFSGIGLRSAEEEFVEFALMPTGNYNVIDIGNDLRTGAAIWILDTLSRHDRLYDFMKQLEGRYTADTWFLPMEIYHPRYSEDLISTVVQLISSRYGDTGDNCVITLGNATGKKPCEAYRRMISLLPEEDVQQACEEFRTKVRELTERYLRMRAQYDKRISRIAGEVKSSFDNQKRPNPLLAAAPDDEKAMETLDQGEDLIEELRSVSMHFDDYLFMDLEAVKRKVKNGRAARLVSGFSIRDPYELCFALFYLMDKGDDSAWLFAPGYSLMHFVQRVLPWYVDTEGWDDDEWDEWFDGLTYNYNGWLEKLVPEEKIDWISPKYKGKNLTQIVYGLTRCIVPVGVHPFAEEQEQLIEEGMDEATAQTVIDKAEMLFLAEFQRSPVGFDASDTGFDDDNLTLDKNAPSDDRSRSIEEDESVDTAGENSAADTAATEAGENSATDTATSAVDTADVLEQLKEAKRQIKGLKNTIAEMRHETSASLAKAERELKIVRQEHRELADLRELVFNREEKVEGRVEEKNEEISYPYETKKRTVVFGGHETWLKAIKPLFPTVKFVDATNLTFSPQIIRNADVVWIQNNCISHSQFYSIVRQCRAAGVQMRYFAYASAEKCAGQLVRGDG